MEPIAPGKVPKNRQSRSRSGQTIVGHILNSNTHSRCRFRLRGARAVSGGVLSERRAVRRHVDVAALRLRARFPGRPLRAADGGALHAQLVSALRAGRCEPSDQLCGVRVHDQRIRRGARVHGMRAQV